MTASEYKKGDFKEDGDGLFPVSAGRKERAAIAARETEGGGSGASGWGTGFPGGHLADRDGPGPPSAGWTPEGPWFGVHGWNGGRGRGMGTAGEGAGAVCDTEPGQGLGACLVLALAVPTPLVYADALLRVLAQLGPTPAAASRVPGQRARLLSTLGLVGLVWSKPCTTSLPTSRASFCYGWAVKPAFSPCRRAG